MKKAISLILALTMCLSLCACGAAGSVEPPKDSKVLETETIKINGLCVDDSYVDKDGAPLKMVYLFYTLTATGSNLKIDSKYTNMIIGEANTYEADHFLGKAAEFTKNYYYSSYIEDVYVGTSLNVLATFKVPEGDLAPGKTITFTDNQIPEIEAIKMSTDDIRRFATPEEMAQAMDPEGYAAELHAMETADEATTKAVKKTINGYSWSCYVNSTSYKIAFSSPNKFKVTTAFGTNAGTYEVKNGYIFCTYTNTGYTVKVPFEITGDGVDLDIVGAFDVMR